jgi:hypothetical protein
MENLSQFFIGLIEENNLSQVAELIGIDKATCKSLKRFGNICFSAIFLTPFILKFFFFFYYLKHKMPLSFLLLSYSLKCIVIHICKFIGVKNVNACKIFLFLNNFISTEPPMVDPLL